MYRFEHFVSFCYRFVASSTSKDCQVIVVNSYSNNFLSIKVLVILLHKSSWINRFFFFLNNQYVISNLDQKINMYGKPASCAKR